jgi:hypothetical protein
VDVFGTCLFPHTSSASFWSTVQRWKRLPEGESMLVAHIHIANIFTSNVNHPSAHRLFLAFT